MPAGCASRTPGKRHVAKSVLALPLVPSPPRRHRTERSEDGRTCPAGAMGLGITGPGRRKTDCDLGKRGLGKGLAGVLEVCD